MVSTRMALRAPMRMDGGGPRRKDLLYVVEGAVDPSRWAMQYGETVRVRQAVALPKLAVKHLYYLQLSRVFRPMRTFDAARAPDDWKAHTTWVDLLNETTAEAERSKKAAEQEYTIGRILAHRASGEPKRERRRVPGRMGRV